MKSSEMTPVRSRYRPSGLYSNQSRGVDMPDGAALIIVGEGAGQSGRLSKMKPKPKSSCCSGGELLFRVGEVRIQPLSGFNLNTLNVVGHGVRTDKDTWHGAAEASYRHKMKDEQI